MGGAHGVQVRLLHHLQVAAGQLGGDGAPEERVGVVVAGPGASPACRSPGTTTPSPRPSGARSSPPRGREGHRRPFRRPPPRRGRTRHPPAAPAAGDRGPASASQRRGARTGTETSRSVRLQGLASTGMEAAPAGAPSGRRGSPREITSLPERAGRLVEDGRPSRQGGLAGDGVQLGPQVERGDVDMGTRKREPPRMIPPRSKSAYRLM